MANLSNINNKFLVTTTGEVLIGQTANNGNRLQITGADGASYIYLKTDVATTGGRIGFNSDNLRVFNQQASGELNLGTAGTTRLTINSAGVVTVGAAKRYVDSGNTQFDLEVTEGMAFGGSAFTFATIQGDSAGNGNIEICANAYPANTGTEAKITFKTATSGGGLNDKALVIKGPNVGIGATDIFGKLQITGIGSDVLGNGLNLTTSDYSRGATKAGTSMVSFFGADTGNTYGAMQVWNTGVTAYGDLALQPQGGNVGIGTVSPVSQANYTTLCVNGTNSALIEAQVGTVRIGGIDSSSTALYFGSIGTYPVIFRVAVSEKMRINSQGQTWIGGSSYTGSDIANGNTTYLNSLNAGAFSILHRNSSDAYVHFNSYYTSSGTYLSKYSGIGFMVGVNAATSNGMFFSKAPSVGGGQVQAYETGIMQIGYGANNHVGIGTTGPDSKIQVEARNASNVIYAGFRVGYNATSNNYYDADTHHFRLGTGSSAGGNLYVGGGVYLGGTATANKLDDYEEGNWTCEPRGGTTVGTFSSPAGHQACTYTKIGRTVHVSIFLFATSFTGTGTFEIHTLPFAAVGYPGTMPVQANNPPWTLTVNNQNITAYPAGTKVQFRATNWQGGGSYITAQCGGSTTVGYIRINGVYQTS